MRAAVDADLEGLPLGTPALRIEDQRVVAGRTGVQFRAARGADNLEVGADAPSVDCNVISSSIG